MRASGSARLGSFVGSGSELLDLHGVDAATVCANDLEPQVADGCRFAALGKTLEALQHQSAHGRVLGVAEISAQRLVQLSDLGLRLDPVASVRFGNDVVLVFV